MAEQQGDELTRGSLTTTAHEGSRHGDGIVEAVLRRLCLCPDAGIVLVAGTGVQCEIANEATFGHQLSQTLLSVLIARFGGAGQLLNAIALGQQFCLRGSKSLSPALTSGFTRPVRTR